MKKTIKLYVSIMIFFMSTIVSAQSLERTVIGSAGFAVQNGTAGLSLTVGEVATQSASLLTQGFQQPNILNNVSTVDISQLSSKAIVYPNPTVNILNIKSNLPSSGINQLDYKVYDTYGKVVLSGKIASDGGSLNVVSLASASYVLVLSNGMEFSQKVRFTRI